ncbi:hypothetical protein ES703_114164 [subsurface metagenome]
MDSEVPDHHPNLPQYEYNVSKSNRILEGAGYKDTDNDSRRNDPKTGKDLVFDLVGSRYGLAPGPTGKSIRSKLCQGKGSAVKGGGTGRSLFLVPLGLNLFQFGLN